MASFRISGVWQDHEGVITHYAFHTVSEKSVSRAEKIAKKEAISLVENKSNSAVTWIWNYQNKKWAIGETVEVVGYGENKYLRTNSNDSEKDNLQHLIDFDWILKST